MEPHTRSLRRPKCHARVQRALHHAMRHAMHRTTGTATLVIVRRQWAQPLSRAFGQNLKVGFGLHLGLFKPVCCSPPQPPLRHSGPFLVRAQRSSGIGVSVRLDQAGKLWRVAGGCTPQRNGPKWEIMGVN
jgi:hypothetical protein